MKEKATVYTVTYDLEAGTVDTAYLFKSIGVDHFWFDTDDHEWYSSGDPLSPMGQDDGPSVVMYTGPTLEGTLNFIIEEASKVGAHDVIRVWLSII